MVMNVQPRCMRFDPPARTGFDPTVSCESGRPLSDVCNSDKIKALHDAFQQLCESNTARIDREFAASGSAEGFSPTEVCSTSSKRFSPEFERVTVFHSKTLAKLSLMELGRIMMRSVGCLEEMLAVAVLLSARYCVSAEVKPTTHLMHRLYVACLQLGLKAHSDHYYRNSHYAYLAGISAGEMNRQEAELLRGMCWSAQVTAKQVEAAISRVVSGRYLPTLAAFARPADPFESMRLDEYAKSHGLSQSSMDLPRYPASTSMAESCPQKIQDALSRAEKPLVAVANDKDYLAAAKPAWNHDAQLRQVRGHMEADTLDSPRSLSGDEDESPEMGIVDYS